LPCACVRVWVRALPHCPLLHSSIADGRTSSSSYSSSPLLPLPLLPSPLLLLLQRWLPGCLAGRRGGRNLYRGRLAAREVLLARQSEAVVIMQSAWRSSVARYRAHHRKLKKWENNRRNFAAVFMQKFYRGRKA
jgi:hypothetical protein